LYIKAGHSWRQVPEAWGGASVGPFREEERAQPGAGARSGRGVEVSPVHKRAGHS
jgi:hypothetical protein